MKRVCTYFMSSLMIAIILVSMSACGNSKAGQTEMSAETAVESQTATVEQTTAIEENSEDETEESSQETEAEEIENDTEQSEQVVEEQVYNSGNVNAGNSEPVAEPEPEPARPVIICIDPGHGGSEEGTKETYDGNLVMEKNLNARIASSLKSYLEQHNNVQVILTRSSDANMGLGERMNYAASNNADYFISVHVNSRSQDEVNSTGSMVLMSCSRYQPSNAKVSSLYDTERLLAKSILSKLNGLGLPIANDFNVENTEGILQRPTTVGETYPDGSPADYYGLIYRGTKAGIPTIIVEHAFLSNEGDYRNFLCTDAKLDALARADAEGIAAALGL